MRAKARREIKSSKRNSWLKFVSTLNNQTPQKVVWNKLKKICGINRCFQINCLINEHDIIISESCAIADTLADNFSAVSSDVSYDEQILRNKAKYDISFENNFSDTNDSYNYKISMSELTTALQNCKSTSPGPDNISYIMIQQVPSSALNYLKDIYNYIWIKKVFPDQWRKATIIPVPKPNKNHTRADHYRPIALTCTLCKLTGKIINNRLR